MPAYLDEDIPILYVGFGFKSLEHAGTCYDGTHLHTFMSDTALTNAVEAVRKVRQVLVEYRHSEELVGASNRLRCL